MKKILRLQSALLKEIDKYEKLVPERPVQCTITDESSPASSRAMRKPDICRFRSF